jgi:hypothetical protein
MNAKLKELKKWLKDNVVSPPNAKEICLSDFEFNSQEMSGSFCLTLDGIKLSERFDFAVETDGKYGIYPPMFTSPLGVPASYPAIELAEETTDVVISMINEFFPKIRPFGLNNQTGKMIDRNTPTKDRIVDVEDAIWKINKSLETGFNLNQTTGKA